MYEQTTLHATSATQTRVAAMLIALAAAAAAKRGD